MNKKYQKQLTQSHLQQKVDIYKFLLRGSIAKGLGSLGLVAASLGLVAAPALAEGSYQVGLNQRLFEYGYLLNPSIPLRNRELYVDVLAAGEVINVSLCGSGGAADPVKIEIYDPSGFLVATQNIAANTNSPGRVSCTDTFLAPLTNPFRYTSTTTGAYRVRLFNQRAVADLTNDVTGSLLRRFDVTITPNTSINPDPTASQGRLYAYSWAFRADTNDFSAAGGTDAKYFVPVPGGVPGSNYVWQLDLNKFAGLTYEIIANDKGVNGTNRGFSVPQSGNTASELYPAYLNYPKIYNPEPAIPLAISNVSFIDSAGVDNTISPVATPTVQDSGSFKFTSNMSGNYAIIIDTNNDGIYGAGDTFLFGSSTIGENTVAWDGKDNNGTVLSIGTYNVKIQVRLGEYHFVAGDAETSGGTFNGLTIRRATSQTSLSDTSVYWNDTKISSGTTNLPDGGLSGTTQGSHTWGNFTGAGIGDTNFIDTYTYGATSSVPTRVIVAADDLPRSGSIDGTVFEDVNYGGGAGRNSSTLSTSPRDGAIVELYKSDGTYVSTTTTANGGKYIFDLLAAGDYKVRVVNSTVTSSRAGYIPSLVPVQTFRTDAGTTAGSVSEVIDRVGGEIPSEVDAPARSGTQTFANLNTVTGQEVQSVSSVKVNTSGVTGIDFGYNFDTIINTNNAGQGSLRQFILNSNELKNTAADLNQVANLSGTAGVTPVDPAPGEEASIFMISDGAAHAGLRAGLPNLLTSGVASIVPTTALPVITDVNTSIDGRTQTVNVGDTKTGNVGYVGIVGTATTTTTTLSGVPNPEVQISNAHTIPQGLNITGNYFAARGISIYGFGNAALDTNANIVLDGSSNSIIESSVIGTASGATISTTPATGNGLRSGILITNSASNITVQDNAIARNGASGIFMDETTAFNYTNIIIRRNEAAFNGVTGTNIGDGISLFHCNSGCVIQNNYVHDNKAYGIQEHLDTNLEISNNTINSNGSGAVETAGIMVWGSTDTLVKQNIIASNTGDGIYLARNYLIAAEALAKQVKISQNSFYENGHLGIDLAGTATTPATEYRTGPAIYVTANNGLVGNTVSNNGIDYPVITYTTLDSTSGNLTVSGYVGKISATTPTNIFAGVTLEFFIADNTTKNQDGEVILADGKVKSHGEGRTYLGSCLADSNGKFSCAFANAGALGLTDALNITATATDSIGNTSEFSAVPTDPAKLVMVKRITAIKDTVTNITTSFTTFVNDGVGNNTLAGWKVGASGSYLLGALNNGAIKVKPGDEVEYTVYYLNSGENNVSKARVCDRLNKNLVFQPQFSTATTSTQGIEFVKNTTTSYPSNTGADNDGGFFSTSSSLPVDCNLTANTTFNVNNISDNVVVVDVAKTADPLLGIVSDPLLSGQRGYVRFKVKVQQ
jgi:parallel beta-helix repeat protein